MLQGQQPPAEPRAVPLDNRNVHGPLKVAIAGLVHGHAEGFLSAAVKRTDIQIVGVQEPDKALFDRYAKKYNLDSKLYHADLEEMLTAAKPQAVLAYTSTYDHRKVVEAAAKQHIAVMMEKPLATTAEDAHAIAQTAAAAKIPVLVNYFITWQPSNRGAYDLVHEGAVGDVRRVVVRSGHGGPKEIGVGPEFLGWLTDPKLNGGGALYDFGCYGADLMTWLMNGERPLTVTGITLQIKPDVYPKVDDDATIILTYPRAEAVLEASWNWPFGMQDMQVYGKTGTVFTLGGDELQVRRTGQKQPETIKAKPIPAPENDELDYLRAVVIDGVKPSGLSSLENNVVVAEIMDAARESSKSGKTVKLK